MGLAVEELRKITGDGAIKVNDEEIREKRETFKLLKDLFEGGKKNLKLCLDFVVGDDGKGGDIKERCKYLSGFYGSPYMGDYSRLEENIKKYKEGKKGTNKGTDKDVNANYCVDNVLYNVSV